VFPPSLTYLSLSIIRILTLSADKYLRILVFPYTISEDIDFDI